MDQEFFRYPDIKGMRFIDLVRREDVGVNPAPSNYLTIKVIGFNERSKEEGAG